MTERVSASNTSDQVFYKFRTNVGDKTRITFFLKVGDEARTFEDYGDALSVEVTGTNEVNVSGATYACASDFKVNVIERNEAGEVSGVTINQPDERWAFLKEQ